MGKKISVANLVMLAGAVVTLLFSFFAFWKSKGFGGSKSYSAWSTDTTAFASTVPAILALAMIIWVGLELGGVKLPDHVLTFNSNQLKATWGIAAAGLMLAWIPAGNGIDKGIGFWLMLLGSLAMAVGAVMALLGKGTEMVNFGGSGGSTTANPPTTPMGGGSPPPPPPYGGGPTPPPPPPI